MARVGFAARHAAHPSTTIQKHAVFPDRLPTRIVKRRSPIYTDSYTMATFSFFSVQPDVFLGVTTPPSANVDDAFFDKHEPQFAEEARGFQAKMVDKSKRHKKKMDRRVRQRERRMRRQMKREQFMISLTTSQ